MKLTRKELQRMRRLPNCEDEKRLQTFVSFRKVKRADLTINPLTY